MDWFSVEAFKEWFEFDRAHGPVLDLEENVQRLLRIDREQGNERPKKIPEWVKNFLMMTWKPYECEPGGVEKYINEWLDRAEAELNKPKPTAVGLLKEWYYKRKEEKAMCDPNFIHKVGEFLLALTSESPTTPQGQQGQIKPDNGCDCLACQQLRLQKGRAE